MCICPCAVLNGDVDVDDVDVDVDVEVDRMRDGEKGRVSYAGGGRDGGRGRGLLERRRVARRWGRGLDMRVGGVGSRGKWRRSVGDSV